MPTVTYEYESVKCGKKNCRGCPHGPYWYAYWREGNRLRKKYIGKKDPREKAQEKDPREEKVKEVPKEKPHPLDKIFNPRTANIVYAAKILGCCENAKYSEWRIAFTRAVWRCHPDRGGDTRAMARVNAAWDFVKAHYGWERK